MTKLTVCMNRSLTVLAVLALAAFAAIPAYATDELISLDRDLGRGDGFLLEVVRHRAEDAPDFSTEDLDRDPGRPAFILPKDLDGDGYPELVVSKFASSSPMGSGYVDLYRMKEPGQTGDWTRTRLLDGVCFPNRAVAADVNGDGRLDLIIPAGFLASMPRNSGAIYWLEATEDGFRTHTVTRDRDLFYHHVELVDLDGDGRLDMVTVGEKKGLWDDGRAEVHVYRGTDSPLHFETKPRVLGAGLGSLPTVLDLDGDGDLDIASAEYFGSRGSFAWLENQDDTWVRHVVDPLPGKAIQLSFIPDLCGDGVTRAVLSNHTNTLDRPSDPESAVWLYEIPDDPRRAWTGRKISTGIVSRKSPMGAPQGAPGVFAWGDPDGDGDTDIIVHGDGDPRVYLLEQTSPGNFATRIIARGLPQGGVACADLDRDGRDEIIASSYENNRLLLFRSLRGPATGQ